MGCPMAPSREIIIMMNRGRSKVEVKPACESRGVRASQGSARQWHALLSNLGFSSHSTSTREAIPPIALNDTHNDCGVVLQRTPAL